MQNINFVKKKRKTMLAELVIFGAVLSMFSYFIGFYSSALVLAENAYPELKWEVIKLIHNKIFSNLLFLFVIYMPVIAIMHFFFAYRYVNKLKS